MSLSYSNATITSPSTLTTSTVSSLATSYVTGAFSYECYIRVNPAYATWVANSNYPPVGTTYLYVAPNATTTSTSVKCEPSSIPAPASFGSSHIGGNFGARLDDKCNLVVDYWAATGEPRSSGLLTTSAVWPGPTTILNMGPDFIVEDFPRGTSLTQVSSSVSRVFYTDAFTVTSYLEPASAGTGRRSLEWSTYTLMPDMSKYLPDFSQLKSCTRYLWQTSPNTLTYAPFLTSIVTLPGKPAQATIDQPGPTQAPAPAVPSPTPAPTPPPAPPAQAPAPSPSNNNNPPANNNPPPNTGTSNNQAPPSNQEGNSDNNPTVVPAPGPEQGQSPSNPNNPSQAAPANPANNAAPPAQGNANSNPATPNNPSSPSSPNAPAAPVSPDQPPAAASQTITNLILPSSLTVRPGSAPITFSDRAISLDAQGTVHVAPLSTLAPGQAVPSGFVAINPSNAGGEVGSGQSGSAAQGQGVVVVDESRASAVPLSVIGRVGNLDAVGVSVPVEVGSEVVAAGSTSGSSGGSGEGVTSGGSGQGEGQSQSVGEMVGDFGKWIATGLGGEGAWSSGENAGNGAAGSSNAGSGGSARGSTGGSSGSSTGQNGGISRPGSGSGNSTVVPFAGSATTVQGSKLLLCGLLLGSVAVVSAL